MSIKIIHFDRTTNTGKPKPRKDNWQKDNCQPKIVNVVLPKPEAPVAPVSLTPEELKIQKLK